MARPSSRSSRSSKEGASPPVSAREKSLEKQLDLDRLPNHVGITMDGNGRWAKARGWADRIKGHEAGIEATRAVVEDSARLHIPVLSLYAFGRDNWDRSRHETSALMRFFRRFLIKERDRLMDNDIRLVHSGCREDLPAYVIKALDRTLELTAPNAGMTLNLAVSYSGREEVAHAARAVAAKVAAGEIKVDDITPDLFAQHLYRPELGNPDLLIRTSGEKRLSDFFVYQSHYAELCFPDVLWPDFRREHLLEALVDYQGRERRYGRAP